MSTTGVCAIKPQFLIVHANTKSDQITADKSSVGQDEADNQDEPEVKRVKPTESKRKRQRGQNKARPIPFVQSEAKLCHHLVDVVENSDKKGCPFDQCKYLHDVKQYLEQKPPDLGEVCHNFTTFGYCPRGVSCRFGKAHITEDGLNVINEELYEKFKSKGPQSFNQLEQELQTSLRKRQFDFKPAESVVKYMDSEKDNAKEKAANGETEKLGSVTDEGLIKLLAREKKTIEWKDKLYLSPLTTVGNLPFRRICKEFGVDVTCGEMAMCSNLLQGFVQEWALIKRHVSEDIFGVQLCANNPYILSKAAHLLQENAQIDFIDLNLGCPIDLVYKQGAGSGLLRRERVLESMVRSASKLLSIPFTVKTRIGVYNNKNIVHKIMPKFRNWGASMITVHGRTKEQRYTKLADWEYVNECAALAAPTPVFGNGDILSYDDYARVMDSYKNVSGVVIGRGALIKPWIFTEIKEKRLWDISSSERFDIIKKYVNYGLEHFGSDTKGVENTRRFLLEWLSFLYRYVPVGVLENPPQRINERPPFFIGRNYLESLMASGNCKDWIKISEMLLGPVPDGFNFLPKHKANSYENPNRLSYD